MQKYILFSLMIFTFSLGLAIDTTSISINPDSHIKLIDPFLFGGTAGGFRFFDSSSLEDKGIYLSERINGIWDSDSSRPDTLFLELFKEAVFFNNWHRDR